MNPLARVELAICAVCGTPDVATVTLASSSGFRRDLPLCARHEARFVYGMGVVEAQLRKLYERGDMIGPTELAARIVGNVPERRVLRALSTFVGPNERARIGCAAKNCTEMAHASEMRSPGVWWYWCQLHALAIDEEPFDASYWTMTTIDTTNYLAITAHDGRVVSLVLLRRVKPGDGGSIEALSLSPDEALGLAAWLIVGAELADANDMTSRLTHVAEIVHAIRSA